MLDSVTVAYGDAVALEDVTLRLRGPGLVLLMGPNGAGKTTLMRAVAGLVRPLRGRVLVDGVDVTGRPEAAGRFVAYMPQTAPEVHLPLTALEAVEWYLSIARARWPRLLAGRRLRSIAERALEAVGLPRDMWDKPVASLSVGLRQRVMLARVLALGTPVLLLDEPLAPVDPAGRAELAELLASIARERLVVVSVHDPSLLRPHAAMVVLLRRRLVAAGRPDEVLRAEVLERVYGRAVVEVPPGQPHIADSHSHVAR